VCVGKIDTFLLASFDCWKNVRRDLYVKENLKRQEVDNLRLSLFEIELVAAQLPLSIIVQIMHFNKRRFK